MPRYANTAFNSAAPGLSRLAQALAGGQGAYDAGADAETGRQSKMAQALAAMRASEAAARSHNATADQTAAETGVLTSRPELIDESIAAQTGSTLPMLQAVRDFIKTGQRPMRELPGPVTEDGIGAGSAPVADDAIQSRIAQALARSLPMRTNLKDTNPNDLAKATGEYREQDLSDAIIAGRTNRNVVGGAQAAVGAKPLFHVSGDGGVLDQYSGGLNESGGLAQSTIGLKKEQAGAQKANAAQSYASAGNSRASADQHVATAAKIRAEMARGPLGADGEPVGGGGAVLGVPLPTVTPWQNQTNQKDANKVKAAEITRGSKEIEKDTDAARKEKQTADAAARFLELNKKVKTGTVADKFMVGRAVQGMGSDYSELESITAKLAPSMREPGSGSSSDYDGKQFERATVGVDKPKATNDNIGRAIIARAQTAQDYVDFRQTYLEQNGTLQGADRHWKQYADKNPIFDPARPGTFELNKGRKPWRDHFAGKQSPQEPAPATRTVVRTGTANGRKVVQYSDGSIENAD